MSVIIPTSNPKMTLKLARAKADTVLGIATLLLPVPTGGRFVEGGKGWFAVPGIGDYFKVYLTDEDDILGLGAGTVIASYTDDDAPSANQGWYINATEAVSVIDAMTSVFKDLGSLPEGMYLKVIATKGNISLSDTFYLNIKWAKPD